MKFEIDTEKMSVKEIEKMYKNAINTKKRDSFQDLRECGFINTAYEDNYFWYIKINNKYFLLSDKYTEAMIIEEGEHIIDSIDMDIPECVKKDLLNS